MIKISREKVHLFCRLRISIVYLVEKTYSWSKAWIDLSRQKPAFDPTNSKAWSKTHAFDHAFDWID